MVSSNAFQTEHLCGRIATIVTDRLYFASYSSQPAPDSHVRYINLDEKVHYEPFYTDFGPLNLSVLYRFCNLIHPLVQSKSKRKLVVWTADNAKSRANGAYILGAYLVIFQGVAADAAYLRVQSAEPPEFAGFRDAAIGKPTYLLHVHDVIRGVEKALQNKWFDFNNFDAEEYEYFERVENGDMNWIIPDKVLSFCGPHNESKIEDGYPYHSPETYFDYFKETGISTIVRLNMRMYDERKFKNAGFDHVDLFFIDGSTPSDEIVLKFIEVVDNAKGGVAIHCKAGLGRTGTLIACWMMKEFGLTAAECMAWLRICRPGSVIGPQQAFLIDKQKFCWSMSRNNLIQVPNKFRDRATSGEKKVKKITSQVDEINISPNGTTSQAQGGHTPLPRVRPNILKLSRKPLDLNGNAGDTSDETALDSFGRSQGDRLLALKAKVALGQVGSSALQYSLRGKDSPVRNNERKMLNPVVARSSAASSVTPSFTSPTTPVKPLSCSPSTVPKSRFAPRNLAAMIPPPISKVTVASGLVGSRSVSARMLTPIAKPTTSLLRKTTSSSRTRPYPSQGARVELAASSPSYDLRSRISPVSSKIAEAAYSLPANTDALLGAKRSRKRLF